MRIYILLILTALAALPAHAQQDATRGCRDVGYEAERIVTAKGHEEVRVSRTAEGGVQLHYADRISRQPLRTLLEIEDALADALPACPGITVQAFRYGIPVASEGIGHAPAASASPQWRSLKGPRVDLEVETLFGYQVDFFETPYRIHVALAPRLRLWWPSGLAITAQYAVPVYNKVGRWGSAYYSNPFLNRASIGIRRAVGRSVLASVSGGLFERNRYGGDAQAYWVSKTYPISIGVRLSMTGYYSLQHGSWSSTSPAEPTGYVDGTMWLPWYNLRIRGRAGWLLEQYTDRWRPGEYLYNTAGLKGDLTRMFGETEVTFSGTYLNNVLYPGIRIGIPLAPRRGVSRGRAAAYISPRFDGPWDYGRVVRGNSTGFQNPERGETFESGLDVWPMLRYTSPWMRDVVR